MVRLPDLGKLVSSSGTSSSSSPLCVRALFFPYLYFPCGDVHVGSELRRCETDDGGDKGGLCEGPPPWSSPPPLRGDYGWRVWNNVGLTDEADCKRAGRLFIFSPSTVLLFVWAIISFSQNPPQMEWPFISQQAKIELMLLTGIVSIDLHV